jgi:radical SAM protein with 4Fe4S-binding SPASM domain
LDIWNSKFDVMRNRKWAKTGICKDCKDFKNCNGGAMHLWDEKQNEIAVCIHDKISNKT